MVERYEIRLSGAGGQGLVLAGVILAEAAAIHENLYAVQSQSYGPEARGGSSKSEVILGSEPISYPKALKPDLLLALTQEAFDKYGKSIRPGGTLIIDSEYVEAKTKGEYNLVALPITELARSKLGREMVVNIISLGIIQEITGLVSPDALCKSIAHRVPKGTEEINYKALQAGIDAASEHKKAHGQ